MADATTPQIQTYCNERVRVHSELAVQLANALDADIAAVDDVYSALANKSAWTDSRTDGPPHLATGDDVLAFNTFAHDVRDFIRNHPQYAVIRKLCVRF